MLTSESAAGIALLAATVSLLASGPPACGGIAVIDANGRGGAGAIAHDAGVGGATGGSGATGAADSGVVPPECQVPVSTDPPHAISFQFHNPTDQTLYLREVCWLDYAVNACSDDYAVPLPLRISCSLPCSDPAGGCISCEMCLPLAIAVGPGETHEDTWSGVIYDFSTNADDCLCHIPRDQLAGLHRITVPVFLSAEAVETEPGDPLEPPAYEVTVDFALPTPSGVAVISLATM